MHLTPAALDAAIPLLEAGTSPATRGAHGEATGTADEDARILEQFARIGGGGGSRAGLGEADGRSRPVEREIGAIVN